ncbi:Superoxide dismutase [Halotydeus destructor]|nr:Superoxide dismutase [Halotydeus destructor]
MPVSSSSSSSSSPWSKFDICLVSGFLFNFACVTAQYYPPPSQAPAYPAAYGQPLPVGYRPGPMPGYPSGYRNPYVTGYPTGYPNGYPNGGYQASQYYRFGPAPGREQVVSSGQIEVRPNPMARFDPNYPNYYSRPSYDRPRLVHFPYTPPSRQYPGYSNSPGIMPSGPGGDRFGGDRFGGDRFGQRNMGYPAYRPPQTSYYPARSQPSYYPSRSQPSSYSPSPGYPGYGQYMPATGYGYGQTYGQYGYGQYNYPPRPTFSAQPFPTSGGWNQIDRRQGSQWTGASDMSMYATQWRPTSAIVQLAGPDKVTGEVRFVQQDNRFVSINGRIMNLVPGAHGLHIHENTVVKGSNLCDNLGPHFNPTKGSRHGGKSEWVRHTGDLGNVFADQDGVAYFDITDTLIKLSGPNSINNRTLVITENADDLGKTNNDLSAINGNSGKVIACGTISIQNTF